MAVYLMKASVFFLEMAEGFSQHAKITRNIQLTIRNQESKRMDLMTLLKDNSYRELSADIASDDLVALGNIFAELCREPGISNVEDAVIEIIRQKRS